MTTPIQRAQDGSYTHPLNGETYPGVSTCIGIMAKPALMGWAAKMAATFAVEKQAVWSELSKKEAIDLIKGASRRSTSEAADMGSEVHHLIEAYIKTGSRPHATQAAQPYLHRFEEFLEDWDPYWVLCEATVYNFEHGYAGTLDAVAELPHLGPVLLDVKTGRSGVWPEAGMQMAAYRRGDTAVLGPPWREVPMPETGTGVVLHVRPDRYQLIPVRTDDTVFKAFLHCRALHEYRRTIERSVVHRPLAPPTKTSDAAG